MTKYIMENSIMQSNITFLEWLSISVYYLTTTGDFIHHKNMKVLPHNSSFIHCMNTQTCMNKKRKITHFTNEMFSFLVLLKCHHYINISMQSTHGIFSFLVFLKCHREIYQWGSMEKLENHLFIVTSIT